MSKLWSVAWHEYQRNVFKKSFIFALLSVPLAFGLFFALFVFMIAMNNNNSPVGYVDRAGLLADPILAAVERSEQAIPFIPFPTEEHARAALESMDIQAYYVLAPDYFETSRIELVYLKEPGENASRQFHDFIQINLLADQPPEIAHRAAEGSNVTVRSPDGTREFPNGGPSLGAALPVFLSVAFVYLLMMSSGYLMQAVVDEKENRTMEVLITSLSPSQLIGGKVLGITAISFTQLAAWILIAALAVAIGGDVFGIEWLQDPSVEWRSILAVVAIAIPSYVLASALMAALGSTIAESQEGQQIGVLFFLLFNAPLYALVVILEAPNSAPSLVLTLLPFTSLMTVGFRSLVSAMPLWQVAASAAIQGVCAVGALWVAGRAFRLGMLRYGQRLRLSEIFSKAEAASTEGSL